MYFNFCQFFDQGVLVYIPNWLSLINQSNGPLRKLLVQKVLKLRCNKLQMFRDMSSLLSKWNCLLSNQKLKYDIKHCIYHLHCFSTTHTMQHHSKGLRRGMATSIMLFRFLWWKCNPFLYIMGNGKCKPSIGSGGSVNSINKAIKTLKIDKFTHLTIKKNHCS